MQTMKEAKAAQLAAEQAMGRLYNARNAAAEYTKDMVKQGIEVKTVFYDYDEKRLPPENWRVRVADELFTMEEFHAMMVLLGYIK